MPEFLHTLSRQLKTHRKSLVAKTSFRHEEAAPPIKLATICWPSKLINNVSQANFQCFCYSQQNIYRGHPKTSFNLAHINWININSLCQFLLCQKRLLPVFANTFAKKFSIFFCDHDWPQSQTRKPQFSQILIAIILALVLFKKMTKKMLVTERRVAENRFRLTMECV
jgi:hypothetical protein